MAARVKLVRRRDWSEDISSLSLYDNEEGFSLGWNGWEPTVAADGDLRVAEVMTLQVQGSNHDDLAAKLKALDDKVREIGWHADAVERYGIWLRTQLENETFARQALITKAKGELGSSMFNPSVSPGSYLGQYQLALERTPYWESTSVYMHIATSLNCRGAMKSYGNVYGDVPSRIAKTVIGGAPGTAGDVYEFWLGFRTDRFGDRANFKPVWDLGQPVSGGTGYNDTTTGIVDATAYGGYRAQCTFDTHGNDTELNRIQIALQNATTNYEDQRGSHIILLRCKVEAGTTCHVRLKDGFLYTAAIRAQQRVEVTATDWFLHALGTVDIPPSHGILAADFLRQYGFEVHASRTSGSGNLLFDCLDIIPCAEGALHVTGAAVKYWLGDTRPATITTTADGRMDGWSYMDNLPRATLTVEPDRYTLPVGAGSIVLAGQRETEHTLTDYVTVMLSSYNRYRTLRGTQP